MNTLVTGANGFLGRHVVEALRARGHAVRALVRPSARVDRLGWPASVEVVRADLRAATPESLRPFLDGVEVLVHLAAGTSGGEDAQFAASVVGTERLLAAVEGSSVRRIVLASTFSVYDWKRIPVGSPLTEDSPVETGPDLYDRDAYAIAKVWQERVARREAQRLGIELVVIRPGFIWGRGHEEHGGLGQKLGRFRLVFGPNARLPLTHVENCADLFALASGHPAAAGQTFNAIDGDDVRIGAYLAEHLRRSGRREIRVPIPYAIGFAGARLATAVSRWWFRGNGRLPSLLVPCRYEARFKPLRFPNDRAREVLGWSPPLDRAECLRRTYDPPTPRPAPVPVPDRAVAELADA